MQVTSVAFTKDGKQVFSGCLDSNIHCWDLRRGKVQHVLRGHRDMITGLSLSPDGNFLLSNATDNSLRMCVPAHARNARTRCCCCCCCCFFPVRVYVPARFVWMKSRMFAARVPWAHTLSQ
jgi:hypothetical protein